MIPVDEDKLTLLIFLQQLNVVLESMIDLFFGNGIKESN